VTLVERLITFTLILALVIPIIRGLIRR